MPESYQKARRAHSLPSPRYMIPSAEMGEYENPDGRRRSAPAGPPPSHQHPNGGLSRQHSHLYPLDEEGTYGRLPRGPQGPPRAPSVMGIRRERKPKVYSSYSVDSNCSLHQKRKSSIPSRKTSSTSSVGSRSSSTPGKGGRRREDSLSPDRGFISGSNGSRSSISPEPNRRRSSSAVSGYSASTTNINGQERHHYSSYSRSTIGEQSYEATEEYRERKSGGLSLDKMRMPKFDTWDSMGILGLTSKMWADTKKRQESFMETTGHFLREERDSYIM